MIHKTIRMMLALVLLTMGLAGCTTLRRKFVRQSKNKESKEDFVPVLQPVEYTRVEYAPLETYKSHYAMLRAYFSDFYAALGGKNANEKRERYLLEQVAVHFEKMSELLSGSRKDQARALSGQVREAMKELDKPSALRRYDILGSSIHQIENRSRKGLKPDMVKTDVR